MKFKKTLRSILCMLVAVCVSLGLFGTVPVKAEDETPDYSSYSCIWSIGLVSDEGDDSVSLDCAIAGETIQLEAFECYEYYDENGEFTGSEPVYTVDNHTWSVSSKPYTVNAATITEDGLLTFSKDIEENCSVVVHLSALDGTVLASISYSVSPKYNLSRNIAALYGKSIQMPELKMYSINEDGDFQTNDAPDNIKLQKVEVADKNIVTIDDTGLITPVSTTAGDQTTCTAYYTDGTTEFKRTFTCYITSKTASDIISNISTENKLYIYTNGWYTEFISLIDLFNDYYPEYGNLIELKHLDSTNYIDEVDAAAVSDSEPASLFTMEEDEVSSFSSKDYVVPLSSIGYKDSWYENAFDFTKSWGSVDGNLTAVSYDISPGLFYYNTEIAEKVFGTSEPDKIQKLVKDWDSFKEAAKKLKDNGYYILSSAEDMKYAALSSGDTLVSDNTYYLGGVVSEYLKNTKELSDAGCFVGDGMWSSGWIDNMTNGKVFAYFGATWFGSFMQANGVNNKIYKVCEGPAAYNWGSYYMAATKACSNKELAQLFLYTISSDEIFTNLLAQKTGNYPNNKTVAKNLNSEDYLDTYNTLSSPFSALYNNAVNLQFPEAYQGKGNLYNYISDGLSYLVNTDASTVDGALKTISELIQKADPDAIISMDAPPATHNHTIVTDAAVAATCTKTGLTEGSHCSTCNEVIKAQETVPATGKHNYKTTTTAATTSKDGKSVTKCSVCGKASKTTTIYKASNIKLANTTYNYTGKAIKPSVTVKDSKGKTIDKSNYTVTYPSSCKNVGTYTITIKFKGNYSGTKKLTYTIQTKTTKLSSVKAGSKSFTAKWSKQTTQTTGYEIQYSTSSKFTKATTKTVKKNSTTSLKVTKLTKGKKYYVRIRTYKTVKVNGKSTNIYSSWSSAKTVTVK